MENNYFNDLENTMPYLKIALEGFPGAGKSFTAANIGIGIHKAIKSSKPIVIYDTERSARALKHKFDSENIIVKTKHSRTLADLTKTINECNNGFADVLIIDSITHVWESFLQAYLSKKNRNQLYFQDWGILKPKWKKEFSDKFVLSDTHIIFTGRAGYEYEDIVNENGKKEISKTGIKMKSENETAYEPDMLILMERYEDIVGKKKSIERHATIIKDRTDMIDGQTFVNPTYDDFLPAFNLLLDGTTKQSMEIETPDTFKDAEKEHFEKKTAKEIAFEEIKGLFDSMGIGSSADHKKLKADMWDRLFNTTSWTAIQKKPIEDIQFGVNVIKEFKIELAKSAENQPEGYGSKEMFELFDNVFHEMANLTDQ